jgi:heme exporter protein D
MDDPHSGYILAAYGVAALVLIGLIGWIWIDHRMVTRALAALEESGARRRAKEHA